MKSVLNISFIVSAVDMPMLRRALHRHVGPLLTDVDSRLLMLKYVQGEELGADEPCNLSLQMTFTDGELLREFRRDVLDEAFVSVRRQVGVEKCMIFETELQEIGI